MILPRIIMQFLFLEKILNAVKNHKFSDYIMENPYIIDNLTHKDAFYLTYNKIIIGIFSIIAIYSLLSIIEKLYYLLKGEKKMK